MYKLDFKKVEEPEIKLPTSVGSLEKAREFQQNIYFCFIDYAKAFDCVDHNNCGKFLWEYQTTIPTSLETCKQLKQQQNWSWNNGLVQNWEKSTSRLYILTLII